MPQKRVEGETGRRLKLHCLHFRSPLPPPPKRSAPQVFARACLPLPTRGPCPRSMTRAFASASDEDAASKPRDDASRNNPPRASLASCSFSFFSISKIVKSDAFQEKFEPVAPSSEHVLDLHFSCNSTKSLSSYAVG